MLFGAFFFVAWPCEHFHQFHKLKREKCSPALCMWPLRDDSVFLQQDQCHSSSRSKAKAAFTPLLASALEFTTCVASATHHRKQISGWEVSRWRGLVALMLLKTHIPPLWIIYKLQIPDPSLLFYLSTCLPGDDF